ncbi:unnamed protein product [Rotaria sp. Silwood1]|nr:unnamed protein product [Rotaria sp. Silwood1]
MNENFDEDTKQRRRYVSESNTNHDEYDSNLLVTSFLQYLRNELRKSTNDKTNDFDQHTKQKSSKSAISSSIKISQSIIMNAQLKDENIYETNDYNEILTLINLLCLRVECLSYEKKIKKRKKKTKKKKDKYPSVTEIDQNLIEYLYYLFKKFIYNDTNISNDFKTPIIDKNNFVSICQTLVRNGCFDIPSTTISKSPNQSFSESLSISDNTLISQTIVHEYYHPDTSQILEEKSFTNEQISLMTLPEKDTWLVVDIEPIQSEETLKPSEYMCSLPRSTTDEQLLITNDVYKSCESGSSHSIYLSPNSSSIDLPNMVLEFDEINHQSNTSFNEDGSSSNVISESKTIITNDLSNDDIQSLSITSNTICTRLTNDTSSIENSEQMTTNNTDKMSRREKKMHERWSTSKKTDENNNEQPSTKTILGIQFPPIAVLRRKFSSSSSSSSSINKQQKNKTGINPNEKLNVNTFMTVKEINTLPTTITVEQTNLDQTVELPSKDLSLLISTNVDKNNDDGQLPVTISNFICLPEEEEEEEIKMRKKQDPLLTDIDYQTETLTNIHNDSIDNQQTNNENSSVIRSNPLDSNLFSSSTSSSTLISISSPSTSFTNESNTIEYLPKEKEEKKEEQQHCDDVYNVEEEKKNNSSFVHDYHASGIILRNDELRQTVLLQQEKKEKEKREERERPSSSLPTLEQFNKQRIEDESPIQTLSNNLNQMAMANIDQNEEQYKKVEIEEIPDDEEILSKKTNNSIEPTDYILTDEETKQQKQSSPQPNITIPNDDSIKFENVFSCYEKAISKIIDTNDDSSQISNTLSSESSTTTTNQPPANDPIALRALQRFEERMNAAAKNIKTDTNLNASKSKSSWSGTLSTSRKSLENLFKNIDQQLSTTPITLNNESTTVLSSQSDSYIRPRQTFDDSNFNYGMALNSFSTISSTIDKSKIDDKKIDEQQQSSTLVENDDKRGK